MADGRTETTLASSLRRWLNAFVGSDGERYVADALVAVVRAAEKAAAKDPDSDVHLAASLSSLTDALRRAK